MKLLDCNLQLLVDDSSMKVAECNQISFMMLMQCIS